MYALGLYAFDVILAALCAINVFVAITFGYPINWAAAVFIALILLRPKHMV